MPLDQSQQWQARDFVPTPGFWRVTVFDFAVSYPLTKALTAVCGLWLVGLEDWSRLGGIELVISLVFAVLGGFFGWQGMSRVRKIQAAFRHGLLVRGRLISCNRFLPGAPLVFVLTRDGDLLKGKAKAGSTAQYKKIVAAGSAWLIVSNEPVPKIYLPETYRLSVSASLSAYELDASARELVL